MLLGVLQDGLHDEELPVGPHAQSVHFFVASAAVGLGR
jgi:hypothetical protein